MKLKIVFISLLIFYLGFLLENFSMGDGEKSQENRSLISQDTITNSSKQTNPFTDIDSIFVIHFHPEVQCSCCIKVGVYAKESLEKFFAKPYKEARIIFKEFNIDQDSSTAQKYKIFWSALGFEKFKGRKNEFKEIRSVWDFCEDEQKFLPDFKKELDEFIRETKENKSEPENIKKLPKKKLK